LTAFRSGGIPLEGRPDGGLASNPQKAQSDGRARLRIGVLRVLVVAMLLTLGVRLWSLEIVQGPDLRKLANGSTTRQVVTPAPRGSIVDDAGRQLVRNKTALTITVDRSVLDRQKDDGAAVLTRLAPVVGMTAAELTRSIRFCSAKVSQPCWNGSPYQPIPVATSVTTDQALAILEHQDQFAGVSAEEQTVREYPYATLAGQELGYLSPVTEAELKADKSLDRSDLVGRAGLEQEYDADLRGVDGVQTRSVDRFGRVTGTVAAKPATTGNSLVLGLDGRVQKVLETSLSNAITSARLQGKPADTAAGVVMDVNTGQVVAVASLPTYNPSVFTGGISTKDYQALLSPAAGTPLVSRAYQGTFPPGSTFKIVSASTALTNLGAGPDTLYDCPSNLQIGTQNFHNFDSEATAPITIHQALVISCDTVFYKFGYDAWLADGGLRNGSGPYGPANEYFVKMAKAFGFGAKTGIDLPSETSGLVVDRANRKATWEANKATYCRRAQTGYPEETDPTRAAYLKQLASDNCNYGYLYQGGDATQFAIGQNIVDVSPLQLAVAYASIANGGTVYHPRLAKAVIGKGGVVKKIAPSKARTLPVAKSTISYLQDSLADVVRSGTSSGVFAGFPIATAGKTGTAETYSDGDVSWYASYGPLPNPKYVIVITIPHTGQGALFAAPAAKAVWAGIYGIGQAAALPGGQEVTALPCVKSDGSIGTGTSCPK
jgi:penicillin-binding protein 2